MVLFWLAVSSIVGQLWPTSYDVHLPHLQPVNTSVEQRAGRATFVANGQPFFPIGVSYHFTRHRPTWDYDLGLMQQLGLNTVRADLAWRDIEATWEGTYRFALLDDFLDAAARHQLRVVLVFSYATSDTNVPWWYWLRYGPEEFAQHPQSSLFDINPSLNDPRYRSYMANYIDRTVAHVQRHPALLAYQVLNEPRYSERPAIDHSSHTTQAFRSWLKERYGAIGEINTLWRTEYRSFDSVLPPSHDDSPASPAPPQQWEDWRQFSYENLATFVEELADVIRGRDAHHAVLVAEMSWWWWGQQPATGVSPWHIYRAADVVGFDVYPANAGDAHYFALNADMLARYWGKPVWVMELNRKDGKPTQPEIRRFVQEAVDYGATGVFYFSWRDYPLDGGNYGLLDFWGQPKPQLAAYGQTVGWLREHAEALLGQTMPTPNVYLIWPTEAVSHSVGAASPSWLVYNEVVKLIAQGLRVGLVEEASVAQLPDRSQVIGISH